MKIQEKLNSDGMLAGYLIDDIEYVPAVGNNERYIEILSIIESGAKVLKDNSMELNKEELRIFEIESRCNQSIEAIYPIYKQINITNLLTPYTENDREAMKAFIDSKRAICHKAIADGTKAEDADFSDEP